MILFLPWPPRELSPNTRQHWARLAKAKAHYRATCRVVAMDMAAGRKVASGSLAARIQFCPPNRRRFDRDNLLARMKSGLDGVCDALGIDDSRFASLTVTTGEVMRGGVVSVEIVALRQDATR